MVLWSISPEKLGPYTYESLGTLSISACLPYRLARRPAAQHRSCLKQKQGGGPSTMTVGPAVDHARPANLRRVSSRTSMKRSCSAPTLTPVWEPDSEAEHEVPSFLHSDGVRRSLPCSAGQPSSSTPAGMQGPWSKVPPLPRHATRAHVTPPPSVLACAHYPATLPCHWSPGLHRLAVCGARSF